MSNLSLPKSKVLRFLAMASPVPLMLLLLLSIQPIQSALCPASTLVAGHNGGLMVGFSGVFVAWGLMWAIAFIPDPATRNPNPHREQRKRFVARAGFGIAMLSFLFYGAGLFSYYCAEPDSIVVHPGPFSTPVIYRWADVQRISTSCTFGRGGMSTHFTLSMKDSRVIGLGGDSWPMLKRNFSSVAASLKPVPYLYDNTQTDRCPAQLRQLFAKRPS